MKQSAGHRTPILYIAPWVDIGGTDTGTVDWFERLDQERFVASLVTTQPSLNRRLREIEPYAAEIWNLPDLMPGNEFPGFILDFIHTRGVRVVHIMNSRLGYNLLSDIHCLSDRPAVVVQLHVEEPDQSGYVRMVASRYGNLVDAFSVTSRHLVESLVGRYHVPRSKCRVIYTGVDAEMTFSPTVATPVPDFESGVVHIAYPGRLVEQKDPLLMVDVANRLKASGLSFQIHSMGDGMLEPAVRAAIADHGLEEHVKLHGVVPNMASWYAACDLVLMTSVFEGIPYVVYEAMAMGLPVVAPALPGNIELMSVNGTGHGVNGDEPAAREVLCGTLITRRDDADTYADALATLIREPDRRLAIGRAARAHATSRFSLDRMADEHGALYQELIASRPRVATAGAPQAPSLIRCSDRPLGSQPLVSVIVPCFNHGQWLPRCLESVYEQTYPAVEVIVVDDASTDPGTLDVLERLRTEGRVMVLRMEANSGPSAARNAAIAKASGRYILPLDADNVLVRDAISVLVSQIEVAGEQVGYIYPNQLYFGGRQDYAEAPAFNLHRLLRHNYCDTCSLVDRAVFDHGVRYAEDIGLGHEDWDLALQMAERGLRGEPAREPTVLVQKWAFTRADQVEYGAADYAQDMKSRHPALYAREDEIKARWSPAISIMALGAPATGFEAGNRLRGAIEGQTCADAEVIMPWPGDWPDSGSGPMVRRLAPELARSQAEGVAAMLSMARGRFRLVAHANASDLLVDPAFIEKTLRVFATHRDLGAIAFVDAGRQHLSFEQVSSQSGAEVEAVAWSVHHVGSTPDISLVDHADLERVVDAISGTAALQWRHLPRHRTQEAVETRSEVPEPYTIHLGATPVSDVKRRLDQRWSLGLPPALPGGTAKLLRRLDGAPAWHPPLTQSLRRYRALDGSHRIISIGDRSQPGFALEYELGSINIHRLPGTAALMMGPNNTFRLDEAAVESANGEQLLGYLEMAPLPLLDPLHISVNPETGERTITGGDDDPLLHQFERTTFLGFIEPLPIRPRDVPFLADGDELIGILSAMQDDNVRLRRQVVTLESQVAALWGRIIGIHNSLPGRIYHLFTWIPGIKRLLLVRPPRDRRAESGKE